MLEKIYRKRGIEHQYSGDDEQLAGLSVDGRARNILSPDQVTHRSVIRLRDALQRQPDRLLIIPYQKFCEEPLVAMAAIHRSLKLPEFQYDWQHVQQITQEDVNYLGIDLHTIRPRIDPPEPKPWENIRNFPKMA